MNASIVVLIAVFVLNAASFALAVVALYRSRPPAINLTVASSVAAGTPVVAVQSGAKPELTEPERLTLCREAAKDGILLAASAAKKNAENGNVLADTDKLRIAMDQFISRMAMHGLQFTPAEAAKFVEVEFAKTKVEAPAAPRPLPTGVPPGPNP